MSSTEKGFTLLEMLISMIIVTALLVIGLTGTHTLKLDHYYYLNDYMELQSQAIKDKQAKVYDHQVTFNAMGHVNQGRTISFGSHEIVIHLSTGYASLR